MQPQPRLYSCAMTVPSRKVIATLSCLGGDSFSRLTKCPHCVKRLGWTNCSNARTVPAIESSCSSGPSTDSAESEVHARGPAAPLCSPGNLIAERHPLSCGGPTHVALHFMPWLALNHPCQMTLLSWRSASGMALTRGSDKKKLRIIISFSSLCVGASFSLVGPSLAFPSCRHKLTPGGPVQVQGTFGAK